MGSKERSATDSEVQKFIKEMQDDKLQIPVSKMIDVHLMVDTPGMSENIKGWVHTHGMWKLFKLPDLEILGVRPDFLMIDAGYILNQLAQYMVDGLTGLNKAKPVKLGERFQLGPQIFTFIEGKPLNPDDKEETESHYKNPRWTVLNGQKHHCAKCGSGEHGHVH